MEKIKNNIKFIIYTMLLTIFPLLIIISFFYLTQYENISTHLRLASFFKLDDYEYHILLVFDHLHFLFKEFLYINLERIKFFILIYIMSLLVITYIMYLKNIKDLKYKSIKYYSFVLTTFLISIAFLFNDSKTYYEIEKNIHVYQETIKTMNDGMKINDIYKYKNPKDYKSKEDLTNDITEMLKRKVTYSFVTYNYIGKMFILNLNNSIIDIGKKLENASIENKSNWLPDYLLDILILLNLITLLLVIKIKEYRKPITALKYIIIGCNIIYLIKIFLMVFISSKSIDINLNNEISEAVKNISKTKYENDGFLMMLYNLTEEIKILLSFKYTMFKNQILLLIFSFIFFHENLIKRFMELKNNRKFITITLSIALLFILQILLASTFHLYILVPLIVYLVFFLRDNFNVSKVNKLFIAMLLIVFIQELLTYIYDYRNITYLDSIIKESGIQNNVQLSYKYLLSPLISEHFSKSLSILLSIAFYFSLRHYITKIEIKNEKVKKKN